MRKQIRRYIGERRKEGFSDKQIQNKFVDSGYDASIVEACLRESEGQENEDTQPKTLPVWIGWFILSIFLAVMVLLCQQLGWI